MSKQNNFSSFKNKDSKTINKSFKPKTVIKKESTKKNNYINLVTKIQITYILVKFLLMKNRQIF